MRTTQPPCFVCFLCLLQDHLNTLQNSSLQLWWPLSDVTWRGTLSSILSYMHDMSKSFCGCRTAWTRCRACAMQASACARGGSLGWGRGPRTEWG